MKNIFIILLLFICQSYVIAQDKKVSKIAKYIEKGKGVEAKELLDELDSKSEYQNDIYFWYVRAVYYRNLSLHSNDQNSAKTALQEGRKSYSKLEELDKRNPNSDLSQYFPTLKKDLFEGRNQISETKKQTDVVSFNQPISDEKTVTLTVIGQGLNQEEAKTNAFRTAIEQAFGVYVSSNTQIVNDKLIKDEIVSITNGNIQNFKIISEGFAENNKYSLVMIATVSIKKLISFCEAKGISVEYKGALFAANIKIQQINIKNEEKATEILLTLAKSLIKKGCWNYQISAQEPKSTSSGSNDSWAVPITIEATYNGNLASVINSISEISMTQDEKNFYKSHNMEYYPLEGTNYNLRSKWSACTLIYVFDRLMVDNVLSFYLSNNNYEKYDFRSLSLDDNRQQRNFILNSNNKSIASFSNYYLNVRGSSYMSNRNQNHYLTDNIFNDKNQSDYNNIVRYYNNYYFPQPIFYYCQSKFNFTFNQNFNTDGLSKITEFRIDPIKNIN